MRPELSFATDRALASWEALLFRSFLLSVAFAAIGLAAEPGNAPTFTKDVAPLLQRQCQTCHRPGEAGPFSMLTYESTRPWAAAMKEAVKTRKMPPWFADPRYGKFTNGRVLTDAEIKTISDWADAKAPEGDPADMPPPVKWVEGWQIGTPDKVFQLPIAFDVPASGVIDYQHIIVPTGFTQDTWVQAAEVRPTDRRVVHHIIAFIREPKSNWFRGEPVGQFFIAPQAKTKASTGRDPAPPGKNGTSADLAPSAQPVGGVVRDHAGRESVVQRSSSKASTGRDPAPPDKRETSTDLGAGRESVVQRSSSKEQPDTSALPSDFLVGYAPGQPAEILRPGQAKLIKAGSDIVFQVHYTPNGHATRDQTRLGIVLAKEPPKERVLTLSATNGTFLIPPGDPDYRVDASFEVGTQVSLSGLHPHMHGRGKDFLYKLDYPTGESQTVLSVPHFNWHWQNWYTLEEPLILPKGTKIECTAHFDNSPNNPDNADPKRAVPWGEQSWDEMMVGFFNLVFPADLPAERIFAEKKAAAIASR